MTEGGTRLPENSRLSRQGGPQGAGPADDEMSQFRNNDTHRLVEGLAADCGKDLVRFIAKRLRSVADARDLAHEAYVRLLRVKRRDLIRDPRAYLYRIAANILYEFELKRKADAVGLTRWSESHLCDTEPSHPESDVESLLVRSRIEAVLSQLSPKCRAVVILYRRDGMTYEEIGERIGISTSMVKKYLARGLRHCREQLMELR
jgi:RNA polymerase sigma factor (sigma-70 family)